MMNQDALLAEAEQLAEMLIQRSEIQDYKRAEAKMTAMPNVIAMIRQLKDAQEQIGDFMSRNVPEVHYQYLKDEMESILSSLEAVPEVVSFMEAQTRVNELVQSVTTRLSAALLSPDVNPVSNQT